MNVGVDADQSGAIWNAFCTASEKGEEDPLSAMWRAHPNGKHGAQSGEKSSAGVGQHIYIGQFSDASGLSYLNARYYNGAQGQFTSEDPMFWGQQNLEDPESFNPYSYAENNPITKEDPSGKCIEDGCVIETLGTIGAVLGVGGRYAGDIMENRADGATGLQAYYPRSSLAQYIAAGGTGAASTIASAYSLGVASVLSAGGYALDNQLAGNPFDPVKTLEVGGLSYLGGNFFEWGVGEVPASLAMKKAVVGGMFDMNSQVLLQNYFGGSNSRNTTSSFGSGSINQLSSAVVSYANAPGANLANAGFAAALKAINTYNANLYGPTSASTPSVKSSK